MCLITVPSVLALPIDAFAVRAYSPDRRQGSQSKLRVVVRSQRVARVMSQVAADIEVQAFNAFALSQ